jgi:hypothetical protein
MRWKITAGGLAVSFTVFGGLVRATCGSSLKQLRRRS